MRNRRAHTMIIYTAIGAAAVVDILIVPFVGGWAWFPSVILMSAPGAFLVLERIPLAVFSGALIGLLWIASGINLGIAFFSVGVALLFVRAGIPSLLQYETWQTAIVASFGVVLIGAGIAIFTELLVPEHSYLFTSFIVSIVIAAVLSIPITAAFQNVSEV